MGGLNCSLEKRRASNRDYTQQSRKKRREQAWKEVELDNDAYARTKTGKAHKDSSMRERMPSRAPCRSWRACWKALATTGNKRRR